MSIWLFHILKTALGLSLSSDIFQRNIYQIFKYQENVFGITDDI